MIRERAIQIGLSRDLSALMVASTISIDDVTDLARRVGDAHRTRDAPAATRAIASEIALPNERPYTPRLPDHELVRLSMLATTVWTRIPLGMP